LIYTEKKTQKEEEITEKLPISIRDGMAVIPKEYQRFDNITSLGNIPDPIQQTQENTETT